jgi:hypothetical protein
VDRDDFDQFAEAYSGAWEFHKPLTANAMSTAFKILSRYPVGTVLAAIEAHLSDTHKGQFPPKPADLIDQIEKRNPANQRPGADEAWAMIPKDEESNSVVTREMLAAYSIAVELLHGGDKIAARMAFKGAYERLCEENVLMGRPVEWVISRGHRKDDLHDVLKRAIEQKRIKPEDAAPHLAEIEYQKPMVAGFIEGTKNTANEEKAKAFLAQLRQSLKSTEPKVDMEAIRAEVEEKDRKLEEGGHGKFA